MTTANAAVAGLGFLGSGLLLPSGLDAAAFAAASLFLAAFQCLQEVMGRSLNWALLRLHPVAARERDGGGDQMLATAWALQRRLIAAGCVVGWPKVGVQVSGVTRSTTRWRAPSRTTSTPR